MQATETTSVHPFIEHIHDFSWSSLWLSGWDGWAEAAAYFNEEKDKTNDERSVVDQDQEQAGLSDCSVQKSKRSCRQSWNRTEAETDPGSSPTTALIPHPPFTSPHVCQICSKVLSSSNALRLHSKTHEGGRPWECKECGACFARKDHLRVHFRVHTGEKPYSCMFCGNRFAHSGTLKSHIRTHTGEKPFGCAECGVCFSDPSTLRMHKIKHTGIKSFICADCGRAYASSGILNKHKRIHPDGSCTRRPVNRKQKTPAPSVEEQLLPCSDCGKIFDSEISLSNHVAETHSREDVSGQNGVGKMDLVESSLQDTPESALSGPSSFPIDIQEVKLEDGFSEDIDSSSGQEEVKLVDGFSEDIDDVDRSPGQDE